MRWGRDSCHPTTGRRDPSEGKAYSHAPPDWWSRSYYEDNEGGANEAAYLVLRGQSFAATFINPSKALTEIRKVEELLGGLSGALRICDPYVDKKTLDLLAECTAASKIALLTVNVQKESSFRRDLEAFSRQHPVPLEVRIAAAARLHDRYVIHGTGILIFGGSLNGLGKKQSFIVGLGDGMKAVVADEFDREWRTAATFT